MKIRMPCIAAWCAIACSVIAILVVLFSSLLPSVLGGYADQRFLLVLLLGAIGSIFFPAISYFLVYGRVSIIGFFIVFSCSAYFLLFSFFGSDVKTGWVEGIQYAWFFSAAFWGGQVLGVNDKRRFFLIFLSYVLAIGCFFYGNISVVTYIFAVSDGVTDFVKYIPAGFVNIRYWGQVATWLLPLMPLALIFGPWRDKQLWRCLVTLGAALWWWVALMSISRGTIVSVAFGALVTCLFLGKEAVPWVRVLLIQITLGILVWFLLSICIPSFYESEVQHRVIKTESSGRWPLFLEAFKMSLQNFPFGMGAQSWLTHSPITEAYAMGKKFGHPHNMYLFWAAEYGWLLVFLLIFLMCHGISLFWRRRNELKRRRENDDLLLLAGFTASVSAALCHATVSAVFIAPASMLIGLFVLIAFWSMIQPSQSGNSWVLLNSHFPLYRSCATFLVAVVVVGGWLIWANGVYGYYLDMREDYGSYAASPNEGTLPRFWLHGNFPRD